MASSHAFGPGLGIAVVVGLLAPTLARASPRPVALEDLVASGDAEGDAEDVVAPRPAAVLPRATAGRAVARSAPGGSAWVSLVGFAGAGSERPTSVGGAVVVGLPFDRLTRAPLRTAGFGPATAPSEAFPAVLVRGETGAATPLPVSFARACVAAALRAAGLGSDDEHIDAIARRSRWSAALPEARVRAIRGEDQRASLDATADVSRLRGSAGADLTLEARLTWRLDRLVFADEEPSLERLRLERHDARLRVASRTLEALFHWQRARRDLAAGATSEAILELETRLAEAEATLDVLTDGWFSLARARVGGPREAGRDAGRAPGGT